MLQKVNPRAGKRMDEGGAVVPQAGKQMDETGAVVRIGEASFPAPFRSQLEFNAPAHGAWNIVHVGMLVPECHQIYVCADNCMRGVVLTAAEMDASDRFSCVLLEEDDLYDGNMENVTVEGITDVIRKLPYRPRAAAVFLVCLHHFVGTDTDHVFRTLEERFPDIDFMRCWMDPVMRKSGLAPEQKLKTSMFRPVRPLPVNNRLIFDAGDNQPLDPESEPAAVIRREGFTLRQLHDCKTYDDYLEMGAAALFITRSPAGVHGVSQLAKRLGREFLYLPPAFGAGEIREELERLQKTLRGLSGGESGNNTSAAGPAGKAGASSAAAGSVVVPEENTSAAGPAAASGKKMSDNSLLCSCSVLEEEALAALQKVRALIGDTEITIDHFAVSRPLGLARLLLDNGFHVTRVYLDAVTPEEKEDFEWLRGSCPDLLLNATVHPKMRVLHAPENTGRMLAIGPKAAWFGGTAHFVNLVEFGGLWGFVGIKKLAALMEDAYLHEKDTRSIVPRKGFGCTCVL